MKALANQTARAVVSHLGLSNPPIDVVDLAHRLGVDSIEKADLVEDGRLERKNGHTKILTRSGMSVQRTRFTIAHELAHLLLNDAESDLVARRHVIGEDKEERFCEDFAAALLLPKDWVRSVSGGRPRTLHTLRIVAGRSNTSLAAACVRLNEVAGWRETLLQWKLVRGRWGFRWAAGLPSGFDRQIRSSERTGSVLDEAALDGRDLQMVIPLRIGQAEVAINSEISVRHGSALALTRLDRIPPSSTSRTV